MPVSSRTKKCQLGPESVAGTAVAATSVWRGKVKMEDLTKIVFVDEDLGQYPGLGRTHKPAVGAQVNFESVPATFEQLPYLCEAGIETVSPTGSSPYTYAYALAIGSVPTIQTYTIEVGDAEDAEEAEYCFVESFNLKGAPDDVVTMESVWRGRQVTAAAFTGALSVPAVEDILFNTGVLYIDDSGGSIGSTQVSQSFLEFSLNVNTGLKAIQTADGNLYFTLAKLTKPEITLEITAEHTSAWDSAGEKAAWRAQSWRLVRLRFTGTSGRQLTIDLAGKWEKFSAIEDRDGNSVVSGTLRVDYSSSDTLFAEIEVINLLAALP